MVSHGSTLPDMAKKNKTEPNKKAGRPATGRKPAYVIYARVKPSLGEAFDEYLEVTKPTPSQTAALELALEEFLTSRGLWPRPSS